MDYWLSDMSSSLKVHNFGVKCIGQWPIRVKKRQLLPDARRQHETYLYSKRRYGLYTDYEYWLESHSLCPFTHLIFEIIIDVRCALCLVPLLNIEYMSYQIHQFNDLFAITGFNLLFVVRAGSLFWKWKHLMLYNMIFSPG